MPRLKERKSRSLSASCLGPACDAVEILERRQLFAAHIVGNPTVYPTIQAAVDAAAIGGTVTVDAGSYAEQVVIGKTLTLKGAQAGIDGRSNARATGAGALESICTGIASAEGITYAFKVVGNNVTIDGFTEQGSTSTNTNTGAGIVIAPNVIGTRIVNNIIQNNQTGINLANNSATTAALIQHNVFRANNMTGPHSGRAIYTDGGVSGGVLQNVIIDGNFFYKNLGFDPTFQVQPAIGFEAGPASTQTNIKITNNVFDTNGKAVLVMNATNMSITGNVVGSHWDTTSAALRFEGGTNNISITGNNIYSSGARGIRIDQKASPNDNTNYTITGNNIYQNGKDSGGANTGLMTNTLQYQGSLSAINNYWGAASGPSGDGAGTGDAILREGNNVTFSPFAATYVINPEVPWYGVPLNVDAPMQAEDYDHGTEGVSYHDTSSGNSGGSYRAYQGVDIEATTDTNTGYDVTGKSGEWMKYTVNVPVGGTYTGQFRVANAGAGGVFHVEVDGVNVSGTLTVPNTAGNQTWQTLSKTGIALTGGQHVLRLVFDTNAANGQVGNFNWMKFVLTASNAPTAPATLIATANNATSVGLTWQDKSSNETGFIIERMTGSLGAWALIKTTAANVTSYVDTTVAPNTAYTYRVRASSAQGDSPNATSSEVTTPSPATITYLSDMPFVGTPVNGWGPVERDQSNGGQSSGDGKIITLNTVTYAKGLGVHAQSDITFNLNNGYTSFLSDVGADDETGSTAGLYFQVYADGVKVYDSGGMSQSSITQTISLNVTGVLQLRLVVDDLDGVYSFDHADWANARLGSAGPAAPAAPSPLAASGASAAQINLTWANVANETGYKIERSTDGVNFTPLATTGVDVNTYNDATVSGTTLYSYRVRATNALGDSANSNIASSQPLQPVGTASGLAATAPAYNQINLSWTDGANESGYKIERSTDGVNFSPLTITATNIATFSDNSALASTQYYYRVCATNGLGDGGYSNIANAATPAAPTLPNAPGALGAAAVSTSQINLGWTDNSSDETGFKIERSTDNVNFTPLATMLANVTTYSDTSGLSASTTYYYRVRATNALGDSPNSNVSGATTFFSASVTYISTGSIWKYLDDGSNQATAWRAIAFNDTAWKSGAAQLGYGDGDEATVVGYGSNANSKFITTYFRKAFTVGDATQVSSLTLRLMRDDGAVVYLNGTEVYRNNMPTGTIANTTLASTTIGGADESAFYTSTISPSLLVNGTNVIAVEIHQSDVASSDISFDFELKATLSQPATPPAAPSLLGATVAGATQINLSWTDNATNESGFKIERSTDGVNFSPVGVTAANVTTYIDNTGLSSGTQYYYRVRSTNSAGDSAASNAASATTAAPTAPAAPSGLAALGISPTQINLTWTDNANNETGFVLERSLDGLSGWTAIISPAANATSYSDTTGLSGSTQYFYRIRATNGVGPSAVSNIASATTPAAPQAPAAPSALGATAVSISQINLSWTDNAANETGFIIERSLDGVNGWTQAGTTAANVTTFSNSTGLNSSTKYYYRVRATNAVGDSSNSNIANATTFFSSSSTYIATGSTWKYLDNGSNQGTAWQAVAFNDSIWKSGAAQLGYGDGDEATVVSYGPSATLKYVTTYFRKAFAVSDATQVSALAMRLMRDDGAVVYLNGREVYRNNMPTGAIAYNTLAVDAVGGADESTFYSATISPSLLVSGTNVITVEIHQSDLNSSDISFDFELKATLAQPPAASTSDPAAMAAMAPAGTDPTTPASKQDLLAVLA